MKIYKRLTALCVAASLFCAQAASAAEGVQEEETRVYTKEEVLANVTRTETVEEGEDTYSILKREHEELYQSDNLARSTETTMNSREGIIHMGIDKYRQYDFSSGSPSVDPYTGNRTYTRCDV